MEWAHILAHVTGTVDQELLLRYEYPADGNQILKAQLKGRLRLSDSERAKLGEIGHRLGCETLGEVATAALPAPSWHGTEGSSLASSMKTWRRLRGENQLPKVVQSVRFQNGIEVIKMPLTTPPDRPRHPISRLARKTSARPPDPTHRCQIADRRRTGFEIQPENFAIRFTGRVRHDSLIQISMTC
jgi:hypothetical protein